MSEVGKILKQARHPLRGTSRLMSLFDGAVNAYQSDRGVPQSVSFWQVTKQIAWQTSSVYLDKGLLDQQERFEQFKVRQLETIPLRRVFTRRTLAKEQFSSPIFTAEQKVLMDVDVSVPETIIMAEDVLRSWKFCHVTPLQNMLSEGLYRYPKLHVSSRFIP